MLDKSLNTNDALREIENFLRDNIMFILKNMYDEDWINHLGVSEERFDEWKNRQDIERKRLKGSVVENRILYYADFYDLKTIITKNWDIFKNCFNDKKIIEYQLSQLESFRNPNAHNRDLLDYQKHLLLGYIGEIKNGIMNYRGNVEKKSTYFPELHSVNINGKNYKYMMIILPEMYRAGELLEVTVYTTVPNTKKMYYKLEKSEWTEENHFQILIDDTQYGSVKKTIFYKSDADYHLISQLKCDGFVEITYTVVPNN